MDFLRINENLTKASKFLYESNDYKLTIITGRDRDSDGKLETVTIKAESDFDALFQVFEDYNLQNAGMFNGAYEDDEIEGEDEVLRQKILDCVGEPSKVKEGVKLLTDLYFDNFDISDYYDDIVKLEAPDGHIVIDGNIDVEEWFGEEDEIDTEDYEDEEVNKNSNKRTKQDMLDDMYSDILNVLPKGLFVTHRQSEAPGIERMDIVLYNNKIVGNIHSNIKTGYSAFEEGNMQDRLLDGTIQELEDWLKRHYSK